MNILYHHRTQGRGVEGVHVREMVKGWITQGHRVDIVEPPAVSALDEDDSEKKESKGIINKLNRYISKHVPEIIFEIFEILYNFLACRRLKKAFANSQYSFLYERYALFNWSGVKEAMRAKTPVILELNYTSYLPLYRKRSKILKPVARLVERWVFKNADMLLVVSTYLKIHLLELNIDEGKIIVLPNAADPDKFFPTEKNLLLRDRYDLNGKIVIGFSGGFYPWHGLDLLIEAFKVVNEHYDNVNLLLVGDGPMAAIFKRDTRNSDLEKKVIFTGHVNHRELPDYISLFDIAVMPNSNEYGSPMKIYEYMSLGKPVIAPRFGPLEDGVTHGIEGFLFEPGNISELIASLKKVINHESLREKMGNAGRKKVLCKRNWCNNAEEVARLFDR